MQKNYWVVRLGEANKYADICHQRGIIAIGWNELDVDLSKYAKLDQRAFTEKISTMLGKVLAEKTEKYLSGTARQLYKFCSLIKPGDIVISPANSEGLKYFGVVTGEYEYQKPDTDLPYRHIRKVNWFTSIHKSSFSQAFQNSSGSIMTLFSINPHADEIESLIKNGGNRSEGLSPEETQFALEAQLEDFLVENWKKIEFGKNYVLYEEDGEVAGQQYPTDVGKIDILARSKDGKEWLVIELKKGRSSDAVVGQVLRYMGYVTKHLASSSEQVKGVIVTGTDDENIRYAISDLKNVAYMTYSVQFKLKKVEKG